MAHGEAVTQVGGFNPNDVSLSWMPLTHDMGLIGFHLVMFANRVEMHLMPTELYVRRPLLWLAIASEQRATILCSPNFGYRHYLKVLGDRSPAASICPACDSSSTARNPSRWSCAASSWTGSRASASSAMRCTRCTVSPRLHSP